MDNKEKAIIYENCIRETDNLQREISRLKSQYVINIPPDIEQQIKLKEKRISELIGRVESLFR